MSEGVSCPQCDEELDPRSFAGPPGTEPSTCPTCEGKGVTCPVCNGYGVVWRKMTTMGDIGWPPLIGEVVLIGNGSRGHIVAHVFKWGSILTHCGLRGKSKEMDPEASGCKRCFSIYAKSAADEKRRREARSRVRISR